MERAVTKLVKADVNENEFAALCSLVFNIGHGAFRKSTTLRELNRNSRLDAADAFELWNKATINGKKQVVAGLAARRAAEKGLFLTPTEEAAALLANAPERVPSPNAKPASGARVASPSGPSSRETPVESSRDTRSNILKSRTIQGGTATLVTGAATTGPEIFQQVKNAIVETRGDVQNTTDQINVTASRVQEVIPQAQQFLEKVQQHLPVLKDLVNNPGVVHTTAWLTAHQHELVGGVIMLASIYVIIARLDDWFHNYR